ncbi:MAG: hypothetical protein K2H61_02695, partial [Muribaculaceae bacterium]|nr:hypothetical protein [Muribaculaceae bacterium]
MNITDNYETMKRLFLSAALLASLTVFATTPSLTDIAARVDSLTPYSASVDYIVTLPAAADDITYSINIFSLDTAADDPLGTPGYLIEWQLNADSDSGNRNNREINRGFTAYDRGNLYRYANGRLNEYHLPADSTVFTAGGGLHRMVQFAELLPTSIAAQLRQFATDPERYQSEISSSGQRINVKVSEIVKGLTARNIAIAFDAADFQPQSMLIENNPGTIAEQTVSARYNRAATALPAALTEQALAERYPEEFGRRRAATLTVDQLKGEPLPAFSAPTVWGGRYSYERGQALAAPTIIAVLGDCDPDSAAEIVNTLRSVNGAVNGTVNGAGGAINLIFTLRSNDIDTAEEIVGEARAGEETLISARSMIRDLGIRQFPTLIFVGRDGRVVNTVA